MSENFVRIRYIGKMASKRDNILRGSPRIWPSQGSSLRIPESQSAMYLRHADEFELETPDHVASDIVAGLASPDQVATLKDIVPFLSYDDLVGLRDAINVSLKRLKDQVPELSKTPVLTTEDQEAAAIRLTLIKQALEKMDPKNEEHFTSAGRPKVQAVREMTKIPDITSKEIDAALSLSNPI